MPKTNYDAFIENLNPTQLALMIIDDSTINTCSHCTECMNPNCDRWCLEHVTEWLMMPLDNKEI